MSDERTQAPPGPRVPPGPGPPPGPGGPGDGPGGVGAGTDPARARFEQWRIRRRFGPRALLALVAATVALAASFAHVGLDRGVADTGGAMSKGWAFLGQAFPLRLEVARRVDRMVQLGQMRPAGSQPPSDPAAAARWRRMIDPDDLPPLTYIEDRPVNPRAPDSPVEPFYVERFGYLAKCVWLMIDTVEMALWGTLLAIVLAMPLGYFAARNYAPSRPLYLAARAACSFVRAIPELIVALVLVVMYGPGPVAGVLALGFHTSGFLGKFFADDIENADPGPQRALAGTGGGRLKVLRLAVLPQVMPQYVAYVQYVLERNVRTATILGVVSAGGIGFELMARFDNGEYDSVATILAIVFVTVFGLEQLTQRLRARLMRA